jgi:hypothetical protein
MNLLPLLVPSVRGRSRSSLGHHGAVATATVAQRQNQHGRTTTTMADMRAHGSGGIRRGWGAALADTRPGGSGVDRRGPQRADDKFMAGGRTRRCDMQRN